VLLPLGGALGATILLPPRDRAAPVPAFPDDSDRQALGEFHERLGAPLRFAPVMVVIAAYNEAQVIGAVVESIPRRSCGLEVDTLVVVDGATDGTAEVARRHGARVCELPVNRGQGAALRLGYHIAREGHARYVVTTDADGQYDIGELPMLLEPLIKGEADFVTGSRALGSNQGADPVRRLGSRVFAWLVTVLTGRRVTDTSFGFRAMRASVTGAVTLSQRQYQSAELLIGVLARGFRVVEQPMTMRPRTGGKSKKGGNLVYGWRYAKVVVGTWLRERGAAPGIAGSSGVSGLPRAPGPGQPPVSATDR
jgi:glycosyltransferase involved in cell wall biosynthesis